jgi:hypothetical protein
MWEERRDERLILWTALVHIIGGLIAIGYAQNYYFHLRKCCSSGNIL